MSRFGAIQISRKFDMIRRKPSSLAAIESIHEWAPDQEIHVLETMALGKWKSEATIS